MTSDEEKITEAIGYMENINNSPVVDVKDFIHELCFLSDWKSYLNYRQGLFKTTWINKGNTPYSSEIQEIIDNENDKTSFKNSFINNIKEKFGMFGQSTTKIEDKEKQVILDIVKHVEANDKKPQYIESIVSSTFPLLVTKNNEEMRLMFLSKKRILWNNRHKEKIENSGIFD